MSAAELVLDARNAVGESPVWQAAEQALYWVDIPAGRLHRWDSRSGEARSWDAEQPLACIARAADGSWIGGMADGLYRIDPTPSGTLRCDRLAAAAHDRPAMRFNDGRCDRQGRFWAGSMALDMAAALPVGALYRFDEAGLSKPLDGFIVPNGLAFSPDGRTLYLSDSHPEVQAIWAFDYDVDSGTPHNRRLWVDMKQHPGRPDGAAVDVDGCYWTCANDSGLIHRFTPDGRLDRSLAVPVHKPTMCAFGGSDLRTLYVTSIRPGPEALHDQPLAGAVFALDAGVSGLAEPSFRG